MVRGGRLRRLAVEESATPFDADVGPDTKGRPVVVFSRRDRLFIHRLRGGGAERVRTVPAPASEPSVWRGRIAWASGSDVLTRNRLLARTTPSQRLTMARDAGAIDVEVRERLIATLDRHGRPRPDTATQYLRLHDLDARRPRQVAAQGTGIGGQTLIGLSFAGPWLGYHLSCYGDPGGCSNGARRYHLSQRRHEAEEDYRGLSGFALLRGGATLELDAGGLEVGDDPNESPDLVEYLCSTTPDEAGDTCDLERRHPRWRPADP